MDHDPIVHLDDLVFEPRPPQFSPSGDAAERYGAERADIGRRIGALELGYNLTRIPPGRAAYPAHAHRVNEEMFHVLSGTGRLTIGERAWDLAAGHFVACPPGGPETAHKIVATGEEPLVLLALSTLEMPELVEYPDSGKFGVVTVVEDAEGRPERWAHFGRRDQCLDYWDGE